jgi:hypothetical protein
MSRKNNTRRALAAVLAILAIAAVPSTASASGKIKPTCEVGGSGCYG